MKIAMKRKLRVCILFAVILTASCTLKTIIGPVTEPGDAIFSRAEDLFQARSYDNARDIFASYLSDFPDRHLAADAMLRIGTIHLLQGRPDEARNVFDRLIAAYPVSPRVPDARISILDTYYQEGNFADVFSGATDLLKVLDSNAHLLKIFVLLAETYMAAGTPIDAVEAYTMAYKHAADPEKGHIRGGLMAAVDHLSSMGITSLLDRLEEGFPRGFLLYQLGKNRVLEERIGEAVSYLSLFIDTFPAHELAPQAKGLLAELEKKSAYARHTIGCLLPLSGRYKAFGDRALKGIELALAHFSSQNPDLPIRVIIEDTGSEPDQAIRAVRQLIEAKVAAIIGPIVTAEAAISEEAEKEEIPIITLSQKKDITAIGGYVFRNFMTPRMQVETIVSYATETLGLKTFAILYPEDNYGNTFVDLFWDDLILKGGQVVAIESYDPTRTDFADVIKKLIGLYYPIPEDLKDNDHRFVYIDPSLVPFDPVFSDTVKALLKNGSPTSDETDLPTIPFEEEKQDDEALAPFVDFEAVFIPDAPRKTGLIIPQLAFYDIENIYLFGTNLWHSDRMIDMAKDYVQGAILAEGFFSQSRSKAVRDFVGPFEDIYDETPDFMEAVAYDTAMILFQTTSNPDVLFRQTLKDKLLKLRNFPGITGRSSFSDTGDIDKQLYLLRIEGDHFVQVSP